MAFLILISRVLGAVLLLHSIGLLLAGRRYPILPLGWRGQGNSPTRWNGLLWLLPATYLLAGPAVVLQIDQQAPPVAMLALVVQVLVWALWSGLMVLSILHLRNPQPRQLRGEIEESGLNRV